MSSRDETIAALKAWLGTGSINVFGMPFAGKDTHCNRLAELLDGIMLSGGDILRNSVIPPHVKELIDNGNLAPIEDYIRIVLPYLSKQEFQDKPLILSSVGRWEGEEQGVMAATEQSGHPTKAVIFLDIDKETALERWQRSQADLSRGQRADDAGHLLETRFSEYTAKTLPVIDFYRQQGILIEVDGRPDVDEVTTAILAGLTGLMTNA